MSDRIATEVYVDGGPPPLPPVDFADVTVLEQDISVPTYSVAPYGIMVDLPDYSAGDLIIIICFVQGVHESVFPTELFANSDPPSGGYSSDSPWTQLLRIEDNEVINIYYRLMQPGDTFTQWKFGTEHGRACHFWMGVFAGVSTVPEIAVLGGNDPPALSPSWGDDYNTWIAGVIKYAFNATGYPTGYDSFQSLGRVGGVDGNDSWAIAIKQAHAATEDPGSYGGSGDTIAFTIGVRGPLIPVIDDRLATRHYARPADTSDYIATEDYVDGLAGRVLYEDAVLAEGGLAMLWSCQSDNIVSSLPQDISGNGKHATSRVGTDQVYGVAGPADDVTAIEIPGGRYYLCSTPATTVLDGWALEIWYQYVAGASERFFTNGHYGGSGGYTMIIGPGTGGGDKMQALNDGIAFYGATVADIGSAWRHLVIERRAGAWNYYVDGVLDTAATSITAPTSPAGGSVALGSYYVTGLQSRICYAAIYNSLPDASRWLVHKQAMTG